MAHQVVWNEIRLNEFIKFGCLSEREAKLMTMKAHGSCIEDIAYELGVSRSTVNNMIRILRTKYDKIQKYTPLLPKRVRKACELGDQK